MIFRAIARSRIRTICRIIILPTAALLSLALLDSPAASASTAAQATCPTILFLGAHGLGEGSSSGGTQANTATWGPEMESVWTAFNNNGVDATPEAVNFPKTEVDLPSPWGNGLPTGPSPLTTLLDQILSIKSATSAGAQSLVSQMWDTYLDCGSSTLFVLSGYSQGAWLIDMALRQLAADGPVGQAALANVRAVYLIGDPAWPPTTANPGREGLATWGGAGYSSSQSYLANGVSHFRSICVSYAGGRFDPICLGLNPLTPQAWTSFAANICLHFGYQSSSYTCQGATYPSNGAGTAGGNWLATQIGGSAG